MESDITSGLQSLSFEHFLNENEERYAFLRQRIGTITDSGCKQATYLVSRMNFVRSACSDLHSTTPSQSIFSKPKVRKNVTKVGIIGCGRLGKQLIKSLCELADTKPADITISTRKPHNNEFEELGVKHTFNNRYIVRTCNIVFLMCLPSHLGDIITEIQGYIPVECFIFSYIPATPIFRLRKLLCHNNLAKINITWKQSENNNNIDNAVVPLTKDNLNNIETNKNKREMCEISNKFFEICIYSTLNIFPNLDVSTEDIIEIMNKAFVGESTEKLKWDSFVEFAETYTKDSHIPFFDLYHVGTNDTPLTEVLKKNYKMKEQILKIFEKT